MSWHFALGLSGGVAALLGDVGRAASNSTFDEGPGEAGALCSHSEFGLYTHK